MSSEEYTALSQKIDKLSEKIDSQFVRIDDNKLDRNEYQRAHESLVLRIQAIEQRMDSEAKAQDSEHLRIVNATEVRYDKVEIRIESLDNKIDSLKDTMNARFDALRNQASSNTRDWVKWVGGVLLGGGASSLLFYIITHLAHP